MTFVPEIGLRGGLDSIQLQFEDDVKFPATLQANQVTISASDVVSNSAVTLDSTGNNAGVGNTAHPAGVILDYTGTPADEPRVTLDLGDMNADADGIPGESNLTLL